jgi:hypothetical protein
VYYCFLYNQGVSFCCRAVAVAVRFHRLKSRCSRIELPEGSRRTGFRKPRPVAVVVRARRARHPENLRFSATQRHIRLSPHRRSEAPSSLRSRRHNPSRIEVAESTIINATGRPLSVHPNGSCLTERTLVVCCIERIPWAVAPSASRLLASASSETSRHGKSISAEPD